jgi:hypothetical protein
MTTLEEAYITDEVLQKMRQLPFYNKGMRRTIEKRISVAMSTCKTGFENIYKIDNPTKARLKKKLEERKQTQSSPNSETFLGRTGNNNSL